MFRIGDFSKLTRVSIKMLRHYDRCGLLKPMRVDAGSNYRYYTADQLPRLNTIIALKDLGFSLEQIATLLDAQLSAAELRGLLKLRRAEIAGQLAREHQRLEQVEAHLRLLEMDAQPPASDVIVRPVDTQLVAVRRGTVPSLGAPISALFDEVESYVAQHRARAARSPLLLFHDAAYRETDLDVEVAVPLTKPLPAIRQIESRDLVGAPTMACVVYTGGYAHMAEVLQRLLVWVAANRYTIAGAVREVYLRFSADNDVALNLPLAFLTEQSRLFVTEVQLPVRRDEHALPLVGP